MSNRPIIRFNGYQSEWQTEKFSSVFTPLKNNTLSRAELNDEEGNAKNVHYGDVLIKFGEYLDAEKEHIPFITSDELAEKLSSFALQNGDIIIADTAEDSTVGKCTEIGNIPEDVPVVSGLHTIPVRPNADFASGYLGYFMNSDAYHDQLVPLMQGTKVSSIAKAYLGETDIHFPPDISEQEKLSSFLHYLNDLIVGQQQKHQKLIAFKSACLNKMFPSSGSSVPEMRFDGFTAEWQQKRLGDLVEIGDIDHRMPATVSDGIPYLMTGDFCGINELNFTNVKMISEEDYEQLSRKIKPEKGDILFARYASVGAVRYVDCSEKFLISYSCAIIKSGKKINSEFLYHYLTSQVAQQQIRLEINTGSQSNVGIDSLQNNIYVIMPDPNEQKEIADYLSSLDRLISLHHRKSDKLMQLKQSIANNMFV